MEYSLVIDQLALKRWHGKIDGDDALLIAFISKLNSHNPEVARYMDRDYFRLNRSWILTELPLLGFTEYTLSRRLHQLQKLGILDLKNPHGQGGHLLLHGRMSKLWYQEVEKAKREVDLLSTATEQKSHMAEIPYGETAHGHLAQMPVAKTTHDHIKNDHKEETAAALPDGAACGLPEEKEPSLFPEDPRADVPTAEILAAADSEFARSILRERAEEESDFPEAEAGRPA